MMNALRTRTITHLIETRVALTAEQIAAAIEEPLGVVQNALMYGACYGAVERLPGGMYRVYPRILPKVKDND